MRKDNKRKKMRRKNGVVESKKMAKIAINVV